jgi:hypothetical protein
MGKPSYQGSQKRIKCSTLLFLFWIFGLFYSRIAISVCLVRSSEWFALQDLPSTAHWLSHIAELQTSGRTRWRTPSSRRMPSGWRPTRCQHCKAFFLCHWQLQLLPDSTLWVWLRDCKAVSVRLGWKRFTGTNIWKSNKEKIFWIKLTPNFNVVVTC